MFKKVFDVLKINVALNHLTNIDLNYLGNALSDHDGFCAVHAPHVNNSGLVKAVEKQDGDVRLTRGDSLFESKKVQFIKIDVEGLEISVLDGLEKTIKRNKPNIFVEVNDKNLREFDKWLTRNNYQIARRIKRYPTNENFLLLPVEMNLS